MPEHVDGEVENAQADLIEDFKADRRKVFSWNIDVLRFCETEWTSSLARVVFTSIDNLNNMYSLGKVVKVSEGFKLRPKLSHICWIYMSTKKG